VVAQAVPPGEMRRQWILEPACAPVPVVACLPHAGRDFPADLQHELAVRPEALWTDWLTGELYAFLPDLGITTVTTSLSRFVADVNRDPAAGQQGGFWASVVHARLPRGQPVYRRALTATEIRHRIRLAHEPYHQALDTVISRLLARFPRLLLLDLHSFGRELHGDVVLGDRHGTTARPETVTLVHQAFAAAGLTVLRNERYAGGWTVARFAGHDRVDAIQVELNQRRYLNLAARQRPGPPPPGAFDVTQRLLRDLLARAVIAPLLAQYPALSPDTF
jgi:N-formylglutamate deformylase